MPNVEWLTRCIYPFYISVNCCSVDSVSRRTEIEHWKYNTRGDNQMKANSSAGKKVVFNGDSWRFSDVAKQAKCYWERFNTALWRVMLTQC